MAYQGDLDFDQVSGIMAFDENPFSSQTQIVELTGPGKDVLEIGCATGYISERLRRLDCRVTGIDNNRKMAGLAERFCNEVIVMDIEKEEPKLNRRFDVIIFADILEHLRNPLGVLRNFRKFLRDQGKVIISVPNVANWRVRLRLFRGNFDWDPNWILSPAHIKFFTRSKLLEMLRAASLGVEDLRITYDLPLSERRKKGWMVRKVADGFPRLFGKQFIVVAKAVPGESLNGGGHGRPG